MTKIQTRNTTAQTEQPERKIGKKAFDAVFPAIRASFWQSGARHLKSHQHWIPAFLIKSDCGRFYVPINRFGLVVGNTKPIELTEAWCIPVEAVENVHGLVRNDNGDVCMFLPQGEPWYSQETKSPYLARVASIFGFDLAALGSESARPRPKLFMGA